MHPIHFVFSSPRSGTTWLAQALEQHPEIVSAEFRLFGNYFDAVPSKNQQQRLRVTWDYFIRQFSHHVQVAPDGEEREQRQQEWTRLLIEFIIQRTLCQAGKSMVIDKITPYLGTSPIVLRQIKRHFPQAKLIHLVRDGRDVVTSGLFDEIRMEPPESPRYQALFCRAIDRQQRRFDDDILDRWCRYWIEPIQAIRGFSPDRVLQVRYEDMSRDFASELDRIFAFLGLSAKSEAIQSWVDRVSFQSLTGREAGQMDPFAKTRVGLPGQWRQHLPQPDLDFILSKIGKLLRKCGYHDASEQ